MSLVGLCLSGVAASAQMTLLHSFSFQTSRGKGNVSALVADQQGALYGTTYEGGAHGYGLVFKLTPPASGAAPWKETVLYSFCAKAGCQDGSYPSGGLILDADGALYGTTGYGGDDCGESGCGVVFKLSPPAGGSGRWTYAVIHSFTPPPNVGGVVVDGTNPVAGLTFDAQGVLYGTTAGGGLYGYGTVFKLAPEADGTWTETVINVFGGSEIGDGAYPKGGVAFGSDGALYGTTYEGGANGGYGTVFRLAPPGNADGLWAETVLYSFAGGSDGAYPTAGLASGAGWDGFFGTTTYGGANCYASESCGTVFQMTPPDTSSSAWALSTIHSFSYNSSRGQYPVGGVIVGPNSALYGTTEYGGYYGQCGELLDCGTVFKLSSTYGRSWKETVLYRFCDKSYDHFCGVGAMPTSGVIDYKGSLYGTTSYMGDGAACDCGTVFKLD
jgi:uncharacterized repeat protein (TIGR03803 family)